ncbi:glycosyltransferase family 2 protein [uncultured Actinomyces sp.]|uniref:glycosyltransferase family 2 protein n=1 Tax=uncultured Actinomyces sp. TaxID=249061 RepID=UPI00345D006F
METQHATIAMLTYQRNTLLAAVLPALLDQAGHSPVPTRVLVVDNDPSGRAAPVVRAAQERAREQGVALRYVHEPVPGIVAGRNRALEESGDDLLVFIDDDEEPGPGWLEALLDAHERLGCEAVTGPTPPRFTRPASAWVRHSGAFDSWQAPDGGVVTSADTGNLLLDLGAVRRMGLRFDPRYGLSGGEDSLFTRQLSQAGGTIRFAADAVVTKIVPEGRARRPWVLRRSLRSGSSWVSVRLDTASGSRARLRALYALKGTGRVGRDWPRALLGRARGDVAAWARHEVSAWGGVGMVVGALGGRVHEYGRAPRAFRVRDLMSGRARRRSAGAGSGPRTQSPARPSSSVPGPAAGPARPGPARPPAHSPTRSGHAPLPPGGPSSPHAGPDTSSPHAAGPASGPVRVLVAVPTYRRPTDLARALRGVLGQIPDLRGVADVEVLVVDNDPAASARAQATGGPVRYVVEQVPGVAAVRNRALDEARAHDLLVFIDDDEEPEPGWLAALVGLRARTGCQAVAGLVVPDYEVEPDEWVRQGGFFVRRTWPTGTRRPVAASNCLLLDLGFVREHGLRFDADFGATGGEDTLFTRQLTAAGGTILWCDEARVRDHVPASRLDHAWILRRQRSHAATAVRVELALGGSPARVRVRAALGGGARILVGGAAAAGGLGGGLRRRARGARLLARGRGMLDAALDRPGHREYGQR